MRACARIALQPYGPSVRFACTAYIIHAIPQDLANAQTDAWLSRRKRRSQSLGTFSGLSPCSRNPRTVKVEASHAQPNVGDTYTPLARCAGGLPRVARPPVCGSSQQGRCKLRLPKKSKCVCMRVRVCGEHPLAGTGTPLHHTRSPSKFLPIGTTALTPLSQHGK